MLVRTTLVAVLLAAGLLVPSGGTPASAAPDNFTPGGGATFNSPLGDSRLKRAIFNKVIRSINSVPKGQEINIFSWNFLTREGADALIRAQRRGVRVRLIMDDINNIQIENGPYRRLRATLRKGNKNRKPARRSWARVCKGTCRGGKGAAHTKMFMFSKAGKARWVVMHGSANFTLAANNNQWNDIVTHKGNRKIWRFNRRIFNQAAKDKRRKKPFASRQFKKFRMIHHPLVGKVPDPVMQTLNRVKCRGARNTADGRTRIRIVPDVIRHHRGMRIARKLRQLYNAGCDVRIGYTIVGIDIGRFLRAPGGRGPVPMKHLVQDLNADGQFDNYFHMKSMTVVGHWGKKRANHVLLNGSANWSRAGKISDENVGIYRRPKLVQRYERHINYWYDNFPTPAAPGLAAMAGRTGSLAAEGGPVLPGGGDQLVFGAGPGAVREDGGRFRTDGVDPFANLHQG